MNTESETKVLSKTKSLNDSNGTATPSEDGKSVYVHFKRF